MLASAYLGCQTIPTSKQKAKLSTFN